MQLGYLDNSCSVFSLSICKKKVQKKKSNCPTDIKHTLKSLQKQPPRCFYSSMQRCKVHCEFVYPQYLLQTCRCWPALPIRRLFLHFPAVYLRAKPNKVKCRGRLVGDNTERKVRRLYFHTGIRNLWQQLKRNCRALLYPGSILQRGSVSRLCKR